MSYLNVEILHHLKLRKALFKKGLEGNCKNQNVLVFDVEKDIGIIFGEKNGLNKDYPFKHFPTHDLNLFYFGLATLLG